MKLFDIDPPIYLYGFIIAMTAVHFLTPSLKFIYSPYTAGGVILLGIGIYLNLAADSILKKKLPRLSRCWNQIYFLPPVFSARRGILCISALY